MEAQPTLRQGANSSRARRPGSKGRARESTCYLSFARAHKPLDDCIGFSMPSAVAITAIHEGRRRYIEMKALPTSLRLAASSHAAWPHFIDEVRVDASFRCVYDNWPQALPCWQCTGAVDHKLKWKHSRRFKRASSMSGWH